MFHSLRAAMVAFLAFSCVSCCASSTLQAQQIGYASLEIQVLNAPTVLRSLGRAHLVYEVHLTNFGARTATIAALDVLGDSTVIEAYSGVRLMQRVAMLGQRGDPAATMIALPPGARAVAYLWVSLAPDAFPPSSLRHRVVVLREGALRDTVNSTRVFVRKDTAPALAAPASGGPWVAIRGPSNTSGHRLSYVALDGAAAIPQRFAVDWALLGADGRLFHGDSTIAANWYGYGQPVLAVANGVVVLRRDSTADRPAFSVTPSLVLAPAEATGNVLVVKLDDGRFATYAHLREGTLRVREGQRVTLGQPIAALGNSGNTLGPHLHFHLSNAPGLLAGEGLPFAMTTTQLLGRITSLGGLLSGQPWVANPAQPSRALQRESPLENMVVRWP